MTKNTHIIVTGGTGFLGSYVVTELCNKGFLNITSLGSKDYDLREYNNCLQAFKSAEVVIHLAAQVGGIGYNRDHPAELFDDNILMCVNSMKAAYKSGVKKYVALGTICEYPKFTSVPFQEEDLWNGYPEETNAAYGLAKKMQIVQGMAYHQQYGFEIINLLPVNLYGPGDNFNPQSAHVIPDLIRKMCEAKKRGLPSVTLFGTGKPTREFLYVKDAARAIVLAMIKLKDPNPVNIGAGFEISIKDLAKKIKFYTGYQGKVTWDSSKPDGQPRRMLDTSKAEKLFGFKATTSFDEGLHKTVKWYETNFI